ncbi:MAG: NADPH:quinone oxidoreductase family protein [Pelistega sp.]|nr:NADPH:quinone oxidoreductase family protein [Pelistega sp.]
MKALMCHQFGPIDDLQVEEVSSLEPQAHEVIVRVEAASVNFPDALIVQGFYQIKPSFPFSPGAELSGEIIKVGSAVEGWAVGDRIIASCGYGAFSQECRVDASRLISLPDEMSPDLGAAFVMTYGTSLHALKDCAALQAGETLLVLGAAGGVGLAAIEIAKQMGAKVIAAASSEEKRQLCLEVGADAVVDYTQDNWRKQVEALTDGKGVNVVYDAVGGSYSETALRTLSWRGRFLVVGFAAGKIPHIPLNLALLSERKILGVFWGQAVRLNPQQHQENMALLVDWFKQGKIKPVVTQQVPLSQAKQAIQDLADRKIKGKVVVLPQA